MEMASVGYEKRELHNKFKKLLDSSKNRNSKEPSLHLGARYEFGGLDSTHQVIKQLLRANDDETKVDNIMPVPGLKLKGYMMSRKKYLKKMKK